MISDKIPYFMENDAWWYIDDEAQARIRDDAPEEAKKSYREWVGEEWLAYLLGDK